MDCPVCENSAMIVLELDEVEIDYCVDCQGIWLDSGELELLLGDEQKAVALIKSFAKLSDCDEKVRACPICDKKMDKILVADDKHLVIDSCRRGDGLWFDAGELGDVLSGGKFDDENKVSKLLSEMFKT